MEQFEKREFRQDMEQMEKYLSGYLRDPGYGNVVGEILSDMNRSRGKRLRPCLLLMASRYGENYRAVRNRLCRLGALVELIHMASLIHDDIVDDAPLRRGMPTTQAKYGKDMAVYSGDLVLSRIVQSLFRDGFMRVGAYFGDTVEAMCIGELGQMECRGRVDVTVQQYMCNIYGKTAALCRLACVAGAIESGCGEDVTAQLEELGINFGYMFQIRDDLLDFVSSTEEEGKVTQADFREGIYTLPVIYALQDETIRPRIIRLTHMVKEGRFGSREEKELKTLVIDSGGLLRADADMKMYADRALQAVEKLPDHGVGKVFRDLLVKKCVPYRNTGIFRADRP